MAEAPAVYNAREYRFVGALERAQVERIATERGVAVVGHDLDTVDIRDGIQRTSDATKWHAEIAGTRVGRGQPLFVIAGPCVLEDPEEMHQRRVEAEQGLPPGGRMAEQVPAESVVQPVSPEVGPIHSAEQPTATGDYGTYR